MTYKLEESALLFIAGKIYIEQQLEVLNSSNYVIRKLYSLTGMINPPDAFLEFNNIKVQPMVFVCYCLPFFNHMWDRNKSIHMEVPPDLVIGGTYNKGYSDDPEKVISDLARLNNAPSSASNIAKYIKIIPFPFFIASEGKNRVSAYRRLGKKISAFVTHVEYPRPEELMLHRIRGLNIFCLSYTGREEFYSRNFAEVIPFPIFTLPLLKDYGVRFGNEIPTKKSFPYIKDWIRKRKVVTEALMSR